jgi:hypothetical protein
MALTLSTTAAKQLAPKVQAEAGPAMAQLMKSVIIDGDLRAFGIDATPAELTRAADVSARIVTLTGDTTISAAVHDGKTCLLGEVGGDAALAVTLPAAAGTGAIYKFIVSVVNTSGYTINAATASGAFYGLITQVDKDSTAATGYHAAGGTGADVITLNGTTTGGLVGDTIVVEDIATNKWAVRGWCGVPAGSNIASPFG